MKIPITPTKVFVPGKGLVSATHVLVAVAQYQLGVSLRCSYEVLGLPDEPAPGKETREVSVGSGSASLTPEQFASWGADDNFAAECIVKNAGLVPAIKEPS